MMLDRGQLKDWFSSSEIWIETLTMLLAFYWFGVHSATKRDPFINLSIFKDRNFFTGSVFIVFVGVLLFATLALMPSLLQDLMNYPVLTAGLLTAPRGVGTFIAMLFVGKLVQRFDARYVIGLGLAITAFSLWQMCGFYLQMDNSLIAWSGLIQGLGMGLTYVPLATVTFATLPAHLRNEGTAVFSLLRNIGSSIGIASLQAIFVRNTQLMHARLAEHVTPFSSQFAQQLNTHSTAALAAINGRVTQQATMIAYNNDFKLMLVLTLAAVPCVLMFRKARHSRSAPVVAE